MPFALISCDLHPHTSDRQAKQSAFNGLMVENPKGTHKGIDDQGNSRIRIKDYDNTGKSRMN